MEFGTRLKELRKQTGLSQRDLADRVGIDFTYLSKIENQKVEPPSELVIRRLARDLAALLAVDETELADELITLAGKIPSDLAQTLSQHPEALRFLRSLSSDVASAADWTSAIERHRTPESGEK